MMASSYGLLLPSGAYREYLAAGADSFFGTPPPPPMNNFKNEYTGKKYHVCRWNFKQITVL